MPDDLPEIGLSAGIENLDKFAQDAKKVQDSYRAMAEAEAQVQKASEQQVAAMDQVGVAAQAAAAQVKDAASAWDDIAADMGVAQTAAEEQSAAFASAGSGMDEFFKSAAALKQGVADVKGELQAWDAELSKQTLHIDDAASAQERLERAYQALEKESVEGAKMLREMGQAFVDSGGKVEKWADTVEDVFGEAIDGIEDDAQRATSAMEDMAKILSLGVITQAASTAGQLGDRLVGLAKDAVMTAARIEELDLVMGNLAEQNDLSTAAMREQVEAIRAQGIQADVAYSLVTQFVQANLDLSKASELARLAQDAAVISMEDSSQALAGLVHGITTLQPEVLRYRGILVDLQGEYQKWSEENNRAVQSMTSTEKQAVALNAALAQGATITGTYESAMTSASKQLRSMPRYVNDLKAEMGDALLPVYSDLIFATKDALKEMNSWPAATKAALAATGALTGGLLKGTSAMIGMGAQIAQLSVGIIALKNTAIGAKLALLGPAGLVAGLAAVAAIAGIGVYSALKASEEAHRAEAAAIADTSESYEEYVRRAKDAELGDYLLTESLYGVAEGAAAAKEGMDALALTEAFRDLDFIIGGAVTGVKEIDDLFRKLGPQAGHTLETWRLNLISLIEPLGDVHLSILQDEEAVRRLGVSAGYSGDQLELFVKTTMETADAQSDLRQVTEWANTAVDDWIYRAREATSFTQEWADEITEARQAFYDATIGQYELSKGMYHMMQAALMADPAVEKLTDQIMKLIEEAGEGAAIQWSIQHLADIANDAEEDIADLRDKARSDEERAQSRYFDSLEKLEQDHAKRRADIQGDIADVHEDLLDDMEKAEEDYQADRLKLAEDYAQDIADAEAKLAQDRADVNEDLLQDLADAQRDYAQDVVDAQQDLARDLEDAERKHVDKLLAEQQEYFTELADLYEESGKKLNAINEKYAAEAAEIERKYREGTEEETDFDAEREALQEEIAALDESVRHGNLIARRKQQILAKQLDELKDQELAGVEERKQAELDELTAWLAEEEIVRAKAYAESIDALQEAYGKQQEERLLQYERQLEDMDKALERERQELQRRHAERLSDLEQAHSRQLAEMKRAHEEQLAAMDVQLGQEKDRLAEAAQQRRDSLAEQLADEQTAYGERKTALDEALEDEKTTISTRLGEQSEVVATEAKEMTDDLIKAWEGISPPVANALRMVTYNTIIPWVNSVLDEIRRMKQGIERELDSSPVSGWFLGVGQSMGRGLEEGFDLRGILGSQLDELSQFKVQAEDVLEVGSPSKWAGRLGENVAQSFANTATLEPSVGSFAMDAFESDIPSVPGQDMGLDPFLTSIPEIPAQEMAVTPYLLDVEELAAQSQVQAPTPPMMAAGGMGGGSTTNRVNNLQFDAHYSKYQSERSLRQDVELIRMGMRW